MKDLGPLHHFLGVSVQHQADGLFLTQRQFALDILERAGMVDTQAKVSAESGPPVADPTHFRSLVGALQYLTFTRPDIAYAVQQICLHMHDPRKPHLAAMKRTLRYLRGTLNYGLLLRRFASSALTVYTDADWAGCPDTRAIHLGLRGVPRHQPHLLVFKASKHRLSLERRGQVPGRGQWRGEGLLAAAATSGAPRSADEEHTRLLRQRQRRLPLHQPHSTPAHEACRDRPPLCAGTRDHR
jgi:hypothetical protein